MSCERAKSGFEVGRGRRPGVTAEGQYTVAAWVLHVVVAPDTQQDAAERLAQEIVARLAGLKPLELKED